jgi:2,3-bisphosphoglycerate-independent phosphoglycerate mutase
VSHHPPVSAFHCKGKSGYVIWSNSRAKTKFSGKNLIFIQQYHIYVEFPELGEKYEIKPAEISAHNLIIGTLYLD